MSGAGSGADARADPAPHEALDLVPRPVTTLDRVEPGLTVELQGFAESLDGAFRDQLLAYGVQPQQRIRVLQQSPMTVIVCDHVELALEGQVARMMEVRPAGTA
jgi:hypothetical protein